MTTYLSKFNDSDRRSYLLFCVVVIVSMLPVLLLRDYTSANELRYVSIASDAIRDGNVFTFTNQGSYYADKPPLYLWIVMGAYALAGVDCMWLVGLFSLIPALIITELMVRMFGDELPVSRRMPARLMTVTCTLFMSMMFTLRMDMLMTLWIVAAIYCMLKIYRKQGNLRTNQWLIGIFLFLGLFTKGPFGIVFPVVALVAFLLLKRRISEFGRYCGWRCWLPVIALSLLWWGLAYMEGGREYIDNLLFHQTVDRAVNAFHHKRPFWYYLVNMWWCFAPWSLLVFPVLVVGIVRTRLDKISDAMLMSLAMTVLVIFILSCVSSKLPVYLLPCIPFAVFATIGITTPQGSRWQRLLLEIPCVLLILGGLAATVYVWLPAQTYFELTVCSKVAISLAGVSLVIGGAVAMAWMCAGKPSLDKGVNAMSYAVLATLFFAGFALPDFNYLIGLRDVADEAVALQTENPTEKVVTYGIRRAENIDVYFQRPVLSSVKPEQLEQLMEDGKSAMLIAPSKSRAEIESKYNARLLRVVKDKDILIVPQTTTASH